MCFSPEASFAGGIIISSVGVITYKKVHNPSQILFATIPVFFGVQQIVEGTLWLTIPNPDFEVLKNISTYLFLIMADILWPVMIPLAVLFMEKNERKRKIMKILLGFGILLSSYYGVCMLLLNVTPEISGYHVYYNTDFPKSLSMVAFFIYLVVTITPLFISSIKRTHLLGILMFLSCLVTAIFFTQYLTSVWCFFAALISGVIYWILHESKRNFLFEKSALLKSLLTADDKSGDQP